MFFLRQTTSPYFLNFDFLLECLLFSRYEVYLGISAEEKQFISLY